MNTWLSAAVVGHLRKTLLRVAQLNGTGGCLDRPMRPPRDCIRRYQASRLAAEGAVIVQLKRVGPGANVFARLGELVQVAGKEFQRLGVAVRATTILIVAPLLNLPRRAFALRVGVDPIEDFPVAFALL